MTSEQLKAMILQGLDGAEVYVEGDDGQHFNAVIISPAFVGKSMLEQHKIVYGALGNAMQGAVHALSMRTYTPEDWQKTRQTRS